MENIQRLAWTFLIIVMQCITRSAAAPFVAPAQAPLGPATTHYDFDVTVGKGAPDCFGEHFFACHAILGKKISWTIPFMQNRIIQ
jgi:hypothetical protein